MSSSFFEAQQVFESATPPEIRLYYNQEGVILDKKYVKKDLSEDKTYIVITQDQYDAINFERHRVIDKELVWITPKTTHWFLEQEELARNPYVKD
jgi:hypothetical protein